MLTDSHTEALLDRWLSLDASGLLPCTHRTQFTGAGLHREQIGLSSNPLILIGANGVSRCLGHCCTVGRLRGESAAAQQQATCLTHIKLGLRTWVDSSAVI